MPHGPMNVKLRYMFVTQFSPTPPPRSGHTECK